MNEIGSEVVKERYIRGVSSRVEEGVHYLVHAGTLPNRCPYVYSYILCINVKK